MPLLQAEQNDDTFVLLGGKLVKMKEADEPSALSSSPGNLQKDTGKDVACGGTLWEENKALWDENKALRAENQALWEKNRALKGWRVENGTQVARQESLQQVPQQDNNPPEDLQKLGLPNNMANKAFQVLKEENTSKSESAFQESNITVKRKYTVQTFREEEPAAPETSNVATARENSPQAMLPQGVKGVPEIQEESRSLPERSKTPGSLLEENQLSLVFQKLEEIVRFLRENRALLEEKWAFQALERQNKVLREEEKLKLQNNAAKGPDNKATNSLDDVLKALQDSQAIMEQLMESS